MGVDILAVETQPALVGACYHEHDGLDLMTARSTSYFGTSERVPQCKSVGVFLLQGKVVHIWWLVWYISQSGSHTYHGDLFSLAVDIVSSSEQVTHVGINCTSPLHIEVQRCYRYASSVCAAPFAKRYWIKETVYSVPQ